MYWKCCWCRTDIFVNKYQSYAKRSDANRWTRITPVKNWNPLLYSFAHARVYGRQGTTARRKDGEIFVFFLFLFHWVVPLTGLTETCARDVSFYTCIFVLFFSPDLNIRMRRHEKLSSFRLLSSALTMFRYIVR